MKPTLHALRVFLKRHGERSVRAYKYTEDPESGRTTFHRAPDAPIQKRIFRRVRLLGSSASCPSRKSWLDQLLPLIFNCAAVGCSVLRPFAKECCAFLLGILGRQTKGGWISWSRDQRPWHPEGSLHHRGGVQDTQGQPGGAPARCQGRLEKNLARRACAEPNRHQAGLDSGHVEHGRSIHAAGSSGEHEELPECRLETNTR